MKMLKKLAALILAATMVLVLFTACGDGGGTGTREPEKEAKAFATFSKNDRVAADARVNDPQLQAVAEKHLDEDLQAKVDFFGAKLFGKVHVEGKGSWTKLGVVVKSDSSHSYMAVAFRIHNPKYNK